MNGEWGNQLKIKNTKLKIPFFNFEFLIFDLPTPLIY